jgi:transposase
MAGRLVRLIASLAPATAPVWGKWAGRARPGPAAAHEWEPRQAARSGAVVDGWRPCGLAEVSVPVGLVIGVIMQLPSPVRLLGIDLGVTSDHTGVVVDGAGSVCARRRARPTVESLAALETAALAGAEPGTHLVVVVEPTGSAWLPAAVFFGRRGHTVLRVTSAKAADLRRFLVRHAKTNSIDAETLARLPLVAAAGLTPVEFGSQARASLDRRVRVVARLTAEIGRRKTRIRALAQMTTPTIGAALSEGLNQTDLTVLERYGDPRALLAASPGRLTRLITTTSRGQLGAAKTQALRAAAAEAVALWDGDSAVALDDLAAEIASEVRLLRAAETERARHQSVRDTAMARVDPTGLAASLPGLGPVGSSQLVATMGRPGRFPNASAFKAFTGLTPRASETGQTDRKHQPMTKAGPRGLRTQLVQSADTARKLDPQLAAVYYAQMTQRGATHRKALCVVAARLAERAWLTLARAEPYKICDLDGRPVTPEQANSLIAQRFTVSAEIRRRRSSNKAGKAPHKALEAHSKSQPKPDTRRPSPSSA